VPWNTSFTTEAAYNYVHSKIVVPQNGKEVHSIARTWTELATILAPVEE